MKGVRGQRHALAAFYPRERPGTHCTGGWVGPRAGLDRCGKSRLPPGYDPWTVQPVASRYTDWATRPIRNQCTAVKSTLGCGIAVFSEGELIPLCCVVFHLVRAAHEFDIRLVTYRTPNKWWPAGSDSKLRFGQHIHVSTASFAPR
jgi:hypothetical protein